MTKICGACGAHNGDDAFNCSGCLGALGGGNSTYLADHKPFSNSESKKSSSTKSTLKGADQKPQSNPAAIWALIGFGVGAYLPFHFGYIGWVENLVPAIIGSFIGYKLSNLLSWALVLGILVFLGLFLFSVLGK